MQTAEQAYPDCPDYNARTQRTFRPGDLVRVGPGYRMGGTYETDGVEGLYWVIDTMLDGRDYYLARRRPGYACPPTGRANADWDYIVHASRISPVVIE